MIRRRTRTRSSVYARWFTSRSYLLNNVFPSLIHDYSLQRYWDSSNGGSIFPFASTRTTNAMMFDQNGNLVWAPANLIPRSSTAGAVVGVVGSGGSFPTGWSNTTATGITHQILAVTPNYIDVRIFGLNNTASSVFAHIRFVQAGTAIASANNASYTASTSVGVIAGSGSGFTSFGNLVMNYWNNTTYVSQSAGAGNPTSSFTRRSITATFPASGVNNIAPQLDVSITAFASVDITLRIGFPQLELADATTPKTYIETNGSQFYGPRIDYYPVITGSSTKPGILIEEVRTNDIANSLALTAAVSTANGGTVAAGSTYLGGWSSVRYTADGTSIGHFVYTSSITPTASQVRSISAIVKSVSGQFVQLACSANFALDGTNTYMNIDTVAGTITASGTAVTNTFIRNLGSGVYHFGFTFTCSAAPTSGAAAIIGAIVTGTDARLPTNTSTNVYDVIYLQNVVGTGWNSVIPSFGVATTKASDNLTSTSIGWLDQTKGTWYFQSIPTNATAVQRRYFSINDGSANNAIAIRRSTGNAIDVRTAVASVADFTPITANNSADFTSQKFAGVFNSPTKKLVLNGGTVATASVAFNTSGYTTFNIGAEGGSTSQIQGWLLEARYYRDASASDGQLQTLTT